jgi:predicted transporter
MGNLFQEIQRRKVFRVAAVYAVVAWLIIQVAGAILPTFNAPAWVNQTLIVLLILGLPITLVIAWAFDLTPEGVKTTAQHSSTPVPQGAGQRITNIM